MLNGLLSFHITAISQPLLQPSTYSSIIVTALNNMYYSCVCSVCVVACFSPPMSYHKGVCVCVCVCVCVSLPYS